MFLILDGKGAEMQPYLTSRDGATCSATCLAQSVVILDNLYDWLISVEGIFNDGAPKFKFITNSV